MMWYGCDVEDPRWRFVQTRCDSCMLDPLCAHARTHAHTSSYSYACMHAINKFIIIRHSLFGVTNQALAHPPHSFTG